MKKIKAIKVLGTKANQEIIDWALIVGGINVGLGLCSLDIATLLPQMPIVTNVIYGIVGIAAIVKIFKKVGLV